MRASLDGCFDGRSVRRVGWRKQKNRTKKRVSNPSLTRVHVASVEVRDFWRIHLQTDISLPRLRHTVTSLTRFVLTRAEENQNTHAYAHTWRLWSRTYANHPVTTHTHVHANRAGRLRLPASVTRTRKERTSLHTVKGEGKGECVSVCYERNGRANERIEQEKKRARALPSPTGSWAVCTRACVCVRERGRKNLFDNNYIVIFVTRSVVDPFRSAVSVSDGTRWHSHRSTVREDGWSGTRERRHLRARSAN